MNFFKKLFRKPAIFFVTLWAKRTFNEGVERAEERRRAEMQYEREKSGNCMIYLACNSFRPDHLVTYDKAQFKIEKRVYGQAARLLTMNTLKRGCYYYTSDRWGQGGLSKKEIEVRKKAFIKERLKLAKLI